MTMFVYGVVCGALMCGITYWIIDWLDARRFSRNMKAMLREMEQQNDTWLTEVLSEYKRRSHHD